MNAGLLAATAMIATGALALQAQAATVVPFAFTGAGFSTSGFVTIEHNVVLTDPNPNCGTAGNNACRADPASAFRITGISGTFSDAADGISNAAITGLVPTSPGNERDPAFDPLVPVSLSWIDFAGPPSGALSYDNLYYTQGAPVVCDFPYTGTALDPFGMAFTVAGGYTADIWGLGDLFGPGSKTYGVGVTDGTNGLAYVGAGISAVPEPSTWALMLIGFGGMGFGLRRARRAAAVA